jgi:hypothetical protein
MNKKHYSLNKKCRLCKKLITNYSIYCNKCRGIMRIGTGKELPHCLDCGKELKVHDAKYCKKHSQVGDRNHNFGKHLSKETKDKIILKIKGKPKTHGETLKKHYCIECKINEISYPNWLYGNKRCTICKSKEELNGNYQGKEHYINCDYCNKKIIVSDYKFKQNKFNFCSEECYYKHLSKRMEGKGNHMFGKTTHSKYIKYKDIWMHSSYEVAYAKYLDENHIKWQYESKAFDLGNCTYTPDFYLPKSDTYAEIKGYWRDDAKKKFNLFKKLYPKVKIEVLIEKKLKILYILK